MTAEFYHSEALELLAMVEDAQLIFMDPPFNIGEPYPGGVSDSLPDSEFEERLYAWLLLAAQSVRIDGSIWLHLPDRWAANAVVFGRDRLGLKLENWIIWHYRFGVWQPNRFINSKCHGLWFSHGSPKAFPERAHVPSLRSELYNDPRSMGTRIDLDVWGFDQYWGRVQGNNKERCPFHPNQLPELYLKRVIEVTTDKGDLVVDPFCGSGTTAVVADALERRCITGDISEAVIKSAMERTAKRV